MGVESSRKRLVFVFAIKLWLNSPWHPQILLRELWRSLIDWSEWDRPTHTTEFHRALHWALALSCHNSMA